MKILSPTLIGAIVSGLILGVGFAIIVIVEDTTSGSWISINNADIWWIFLILGFLFGAVIGGIEALFVIYLQIRILWIISFGLAVGLSYLILAAIDARGLWDENFQRFAQLVVIWQFIYPTIISLIFVSPNKVE